MGTLFHEALAQLYLGASYEAVIKLVKAEMSKDDIALVAMLKGYYDQVLVEDLEKYEVIATEYVFNFPATEENPHLTVTGAIDLIVKEKHTNIIHGIEHKTCQTFREEAFGYLDEQPRVYTKALQHYAKQHGYTPGFIYINEVKKLLRDFQYRRTQMVYSEEDLTNFWELWLAKAQACYNLATQPEPRTLPQPSYFACKMCAFQQVCAGHGYAPVTKETMLTDYSGEFKERECDHLEEKHDLARRLNANEEADR